MVDGNIHSLFRFFSSLLCICVCDNFYLGYKSLYHFYVVRTCSSGSSYVIWSATKNATEIALSFLVLGGCNKLVEWQTFRLYRDSKLSAMKSHIKFVYNFVNFRLWQSICVYLCGEFISILMDKINAIATSALFLSLKKFFFTFVWRIWQRISKMLLYTSSLHKNNMYFLPKLCKNTPFNVPFLVFLIVNQWQWLLHFYCH